MKTTLTHPNGKTRKQLRTKLTNTGGSLNSENKRGKAQWVTTQWESWKGAAWGQEMRSDTNYCYTRELAEKQHNELVSQLEAIGYKISKS